MINNICTKSRIKMQITFSRFGNYGRLGNQLFQYAAMMGFADALQCKLVLPPWEYAEYFEGKFPEGVAEQTAANSNLFEHKFEHDPEMLLRLQLHVADDCGLTDLLGYFQTEKYWAKSRQLVRNALTFKKSFTDQLRRKYWKSFADHKKVIAIHIRRGDYVGNSNYAQLPITYFICALFKHFPDWQNHNIIIFSDDIGYCKVHFDCLENVAFAEGNHDIEDLALMSLCHHFILSNSTFAWWGAYLGQKNGSRVVRPAKYFEGELARKCPSTADFYPEHWEVGKIDNLRIDLKDVTFTIPVAYDSKDRKKNLDLCVCMLQHHFDTNVIIGEQGGHAFVYMHEHCKYIAFSDMRFFHRTQMLNMLARIAQTKFVANWDADVIVPPLQLWTAVQRLRAGADMVYPYEKNFARVPRLPWFSAIEKAIDIGVVGDTKFNGMNNNDPVSVGGAVIVNRAEFFRAGGENENFISFGPEDAERWFRFNLLGYKVERSLGTLYHINHYVGPNSSNQHGHVKSNRKEWETVQAMNSDQLAYYVDTWAWATAVKERQA